nr:hypothetical protein [Tanacetum cinerariifolium]
MSKQRFASQVDVYHNVSKPVTQHYLPKKSESTFAKPNHMIASSSSRNSSKNMPRFRSNDMVHNHYLDEAKKKTQERDRNSKLSVMTPARFQSATTDSKPKPRSTNHSSRSLPISKSSCVTMPAMPKADHSKSPSSSSDYTRFFCSTCNKCVFNANHNACITKTLKEVNSCAKIQSHKIKERNKPIDQKSHTQIPGRQIFIGHKFSPNKTFAVYEKISPRTDFRWQPTDRIFKSVGLRWLPTGKLFDSCTNKVESEPPHGSNIDISKIHECKQTLDLSAGTSINVPNEQNLNASAGILWNVNEENLRTMPSDQNSSDPTPECKTMASDQLSSDPALECQTTTLNHDSLSPAIQRQEKVTQADRTVTMSNELDLLFSLMFGELLNGSSKIVSKSSAVSAADALNQQTYAENDQVADDEFINIFSNPVQDQRETSTRHRTLERSNLLNFKRTTFRLTPTLEAPFAKRARQGVPQDVHAASLQVPASVHATPSIATDVLVPAAPSIAADVSVPAALSIAADVSVSDAPSVHADMEVDADESRLYDTQTASEHVSTEHTIDESTPSSSRSCRKHIAKKKVTPIVDVDDDALIMFDSASESNDDPLPYTPYAGWEMVPIPLGSIHAYYDMEEHTKHFTSLHELLQMVEKNDLRKLLGSLADEDAHAFWRNQDSWHIRSWRLYPRAQVHVLETVDGRVIYMFFDVFYPLSAATLKRMLKHGLEVPKLLLLFDS